MHENVLERQLAMSKHSSVGVQKEGFKKLQLILGTCVRATERHLPHGIAHCYLPPDTGQCVPGRPTRLTYPEGWKTELTLITVREFATFGFKVR